jgi:hypothetical protein
MAIIQPYQSGRADYGVDDFAVVDTDFTVEGSIHVQSDPKPTVPIQFFSAAMVLVAEIDDYIYFTFNEKWYEIDSWEMQVNRYAVGVDKIVIGGFARFYHGSKEHIGIIEKIESPVGLGGKASETWKISGRGVEAALSFRICMTDTASGTGYHATNDKAETIMRHYVDAECINPTDAKRVITGLTLAADSARGATIKYNARLQPLTDVLYDICTASGLSYGLVWSGSGLNFTFTVYAGTDRSSTVVLSPEYDNIETMNYYQSSIDMKNVAYGGGTGDAAARTVREYYSGTEPEYWGRRELFIEASDCLDSTAIDDRSKSVLATKSVATAFEVNYLESNTFVFGTDFTIGDTVKVVFPNLVTASYQIVSTSQTINKAGVKTVLGFGKTIKNLQSVLMDLTKEQSATLRR